MAITILAARLQREKPMSRQEFERFESAVGVIVEVLSKLWCTSKQTRVDYAAVLIGFGIYHRRRQQRTAGAHMMCTSMLTSARRSIRACRLGNYCLFAAWILRFRPTLFSVQHEMRTHTKRNDAKFRKIFPVSHTNTSAAFHVRPLLPLYR